ncbi:gp19 tail tube monomer [Delftia phage PhiW-14]|uniref:Gp19 tail tube monomer n=1 Tax=Delftia phage PhiW-14 TaxID=665032 RepID=C9DFY5_BPW14|nr:tail tube protein [Delftia phage PhiW-14]ACV50036.1 gp19 tail tube monomer [Delftia phage PhiW-14]
MLSMNDFFGLVRKHGLQRTNRYQILITIPQAVTDMLDKQVIEFAETGTQSTKLLAIGNSQEKVLSLMATNIMVPGYNVSTTDMKVGHTRKIANGVNYGEFTAVFRCTGEMFEKKIFDAWRKVVVGSDHSLGFYDSYIGTIKVMTTDQNDNVTYETSMSEAYPLTVTEMTLNRDERDAFATISVSFTYRKLFNTDEDYGEKRNVQPPKFSGEYAPRTDGLQITADGLARAPNRVTEYPQLALPAPPRNQTRPLYLMDVYTSIERVKVRIEDGTLDPNLGSKMLRSMGADVGVNFTPNPDVDNLINYVDDMIYSLEGR